MNFSHLALALLAAVLLLSGVPTTSSAPVVALPLDRASLCEITYPENDSPFKKLCRQIMKELGC